MSNQDEKREAILAQLRNPHSRAREEFGTYINEIKEERGSEKIRALVQGMTAVLAGATAIVAAAPAAGVIVPAALAIGTVSLGRAAIAHIREQAADVDNESAREKFANNQTRSTISERWQAMKESVSQKFASEKAVGAPAQTAPTQTVQTAPVTPGKAEPAQAKTTPAALTKEEKQEAILSQLRNPHSRAREEFGAYIEEVKSERGNEKVRALAQGMTAVLAGATAIVAAAPAAGVIVPTALTIGAISLGRAAIAHIREQAADVDNESARESFAKNQTRTTISEKWQSLKAGIAQKFASEKTQESSPRDRASGILAAVANTLDDAKVHRPTDKFDMPVCEGGDRVVAGHRANRLNAELLHGVEVSSSNQGFSAQEYESHFGLNGQFNPNGYEAIRSLAATRLLKALKDLGYDRDKVNVKSPGTWEKIQSASRDAMTDLVPALKRCQLPEPLIAEYAKNRTQEIGLRQRQEVAKEIDTPKPIASSPELTRKKGNGRVLAGGAIIIGSMVASRRLDSLDNAQIFDAVGINQDALNTMPLPGALNSTLSAVTTNLSRLGLHYAQVGNASDLTMPALSANVAQQVRRVNNVNVNDPSLDAKWGIDSSLPTRGSADSLDRMGVDEWNEAPSPKP
jgi:hypothetical protein